MALPAQVFEGTAVVPAPDAASTLVHGRTFCLADRTGDIVPERPHGLFFLDARLLSRFQLLVNGRPLEGLAIDSAEPYEATFVTRMHPVPGHADAHVVVRRHRAIGRGMREIVTIINYGMDAHDVELELRCEADLAHVFEVKHGNIIHQGGYSQQLYPQGLSFGHHTDGRNDTVDVSFSRPADLEPGVARWRVRLASDDQWQLCIGVRFTREGTAYVPQFRCGVEDEDEPPLARGGRWRPPPLMVHSTDVTLEHTVAVSIDDLGSLRIFDPHHPQLPVIAAGAPWYMTLFGRDSLLTSWMSLPTDPVLADGVLRTLARLQGSRIDDVTDQEPGRILHEVRSTGTDTLDTDSGEVYYGTVDATPLWVMLLGELARWQPTTLVADLIVNADRALEWIETHGDRDGDGFVEYHRRTPTGLANQGWKDSWDAIHHANGELAEGPIALCEVQAYVYGAYRARAELATALGDDATAVRCHERADELASRFDTAFWDEELGCYVLALDRDKQPVRVVSSNAGHCLWSGIAYPSRAGQLADTLLSSTMFSGWGVRTLDARTRAFNPISYHNGSVWPHDNALIAEGLSRYGLFTHANRIIRAQLDVAARLDHRLPELLAGFDRSQVGVPASYPASCSPQAWASAAPLLWMRSMLRLDPVQGGSSLSIDPHLPPGMTRLSVEGIHVAGRDIGVYVAEGQVAIRGAEALDVQIGSAGLAS